MARIQRVAVYVAASDDEVLTQLLAARLPVMTRGAHRHQPVQCRIGLTTRRFYRDDVVYRDCGLYPLLFETWLAKRIFSKFCPS